MTMFARLKTLLRWQKAEGVTPHSAADSSIVPSPQTRKRSFDKVNQYLENGTIGNEHRSTESESPAEIYAPKRVKLSRGGSMKQHPDGSMASYAANPSASLANERGKAVDIRLMPPPAIPKSRRPRSKMAQTPSPRIPASRRDDDDARSSKSEQTTTSVSHRLDGNDRFELERAQRYADACALPANSGIWSSAEHELFYHIAMRGYDPLLPTNWMRDFKTLPIALFAHQIDDTPLITSTRDTEFRAIKALRDLFETGKLIRDKILSSPGFNVENTLRHAIERYINWGMSDVGLASTNAVLPVHRIAVRKKSQRTSDLIDELESDLFDLARQHRDERGILPSIEVPSSPPARDSGAPSVQDYPEGLPTLVGLMITSGILVIFTLNLNVKKIKTEPRTGIGTSPDNQEMGIRYIARFDFSDAGMDVWNALAVAIVCMMLRKIQLETGVLTTTPERTKREQDGADHMEHDPDL